MRSQTSFLLLLLVLAQLLSLHPTLVEGAYEVKAKVGDFLDVFSVDKGEGGRDNGGKKPTSPTKGKAPAALVAGPSTTRPVSGPKSVPVLAGSGLGPGPGTSTAAAKAAAKERSAPMATMAMAHNHILPDKYRAPKYTPPATKHAFKEVDFHGRTFKMRVEAGTIISWITRGMEAEGMVSSIFDKVLRMGKSTDPAVEQGHCTPYAREQNGGKHAIVLDVGANAGFYGMYAAAIGCRTYFFDIQTACLDWINSTIYENKFHHASAVPHPVGNVSQPVHLDVSSNGCHGTFTLSTTGDKWYKEDMKKNEPLDIDMVRLDDIFHESMKQHTLPPIALIKIDTEGFEAGVVSSMYKLARHVQKSTGKGTLRNLISEVAPERWAGLPGGGLTRQQVADIYCETLWDAGFQDVQAYGNANAKRRFLSRAELHAYIATGVFSSISEDFLFTRTHSTTADEELSLFH